MTKKALLSCVVAGILLGSPLLTRLTSSIKENKPAINFHTPVYEEGYALPQRITKDLTIGPKLGIIIVNGTVTVDSSAHLTIEKGATLAVQEYGALRIQGTLSAIGTPKNTISFITNEQNETNKHWGGIMFEQGSTGIMNNTSIHHATPSISCARGAQVSLNNIAFAYSSPTQGTTFGCE